jgi:pimeloyl-ACP methyl ester carboxylesterase
MTPPRPPLSRRALWALILGVLSLLGGGLVTGIPAMFVAREARRDVRLTGGALRGHEIAAVGFGLGLVGTIASIVLITALISNPDKLVNRHPWKLPQPAPDASSAELKRYYTQKVTWRKCGDGDDHCARVTVPVDYEDPEGETLKIAVAVVPARGPGGRSLFVNPGGPGASGKDFAEYMAADLDRSLRRKYDVVGVDPRGVADSTPIDCLTDRQMDRFTVSDPDPDTAVEIEEYRTHTWRMGEGCLKRSGEVAEHVSTEEAARDLDIVRALLGRDKLDFFGASYGTQLGATYATLFPEHSGRMVLDGAVGPALGSMEASIGQAIGFGRALRAYVRDCVKESDCPLGREVRRAHATIRKLLKDLDARPIKTAERRRLTEANAFYGIALTLYERETWPGLTSGLAAALDGDGTVLLKMSDAYFGRESDGSYATNLGEAFPAITCLDTSSRPTVDDIREAMPRFMKASNVFGPMFAWGALRCADWPIEATHPQIELDASGADPILVLGTTRDPATPYEWARDMAKQLEPAILVTRDGDGHTAYHSGNRCIRRAVNDYLAHGIVPDAGTVCR